MKEESSLMRESCWPSVHCFRTLSGSTKWFDQSVAYRPPPPPRFCESAQNILYINRIGLQANKKGPQLTEIVPLYQTKNQKRKQKQQATKNNIRIKILFFTSSRSKNNDITKFGPARLYNPPPPNIKTLVA